MTRQTLDAAVERARTADTMVYVLPEIGVHDRETFFEAVRSRMPLNPPVYRKWQALSDSLWTGLHALDCRRIVIAWPNAGLMDERAPEDFRTALAVLQDVAESLGSEKYTVGRPKEVYVLLS